MIRSCTHKHMHTLSPEFDDHYIELRNTDLFLLTQVCQYRLLIKLSFSSLYSPLTHSLKTNILIGISGKNARASTNLVWWRVMKVNFRWTLAVVLFCEAALMIWPVMSPYFGVGQHVYTLKCTCKDGYSFVGVSSQWKEREPLEAQLKVLEWGGHIKRLLELIQYGTESCRMVWDECKCFISKCPWGK